MSYQSPSLRCQKNSFEILIVDDDQIVRLLHRRNLENLAISHPISEHKNGQHALEYLQKNENNETQFLVLLDINMPIMNGWQFLQECQKSLRQKHIFTVMLTSSTTKNDKEKALSFPQVIDFFEKPFLRHSARGLTTLKEIGHFFSITTNSVTDLSFKA